MKEPYISQGVVTALSEWRKVRETEAAKADQRFVDMLEQVTGMMCCTRQVNEMAKHWCSDVLK